PNRSRGEAGDEVRGSDAHGSQALPGGLDGLQIPGDEGGAWESERSGGPRRAVGPARRPAATRGNSEAGRRRSDGPRAIRRQSAAQTFRLQGRLQQRSRAAITPILRRESLSGRLISLS